MVKKKTFEVELLYYFVDYTEIIKEFDLFKLQILANSMTKFHQENTMNSLQVLSDSHCYQSLSIEALNVIAFADMNFQNYQFILKDRFRLIFQLFCHTKCY